jgi:hypothetical protein
MTPAVSEEMVERAWGAMLPGNLSVISITKDDLRFALDVALSTLAPSAAPSEQEAGALIIAEIERLDRLAGRTAG